MPADDREEPQPGSVFCRRRTELPHVFARELGMTPELAQQTRVLVTMGCREECPDTRSLAARGSERETARAGPCDPGRNRTARKAAYSEGGLRALVDAAIKRVTSISTSIALHEIASPSIDTTGSVSAAAATRRSPGISARAIETLRSFRNNSSIVSR